MLTGFAPLQALIIVLILAAIVTGLVFWLRWIAGGRKSGSKGPKQ